VSDLRLIAHASSIVCISLAARKGVETESTILAISDHPSSSIRSTFDLYLLHQYHSQTYIRPYSIDDEHIATHSR
jgi:hypothetical protein